MNSPDMLSVMFYLAGKNMDFIFKFVYGKTERKNNLIFIFINFLF